MGTSTSVTSVEMESPPITVIPKAFQISEPTPLSKAMGVIPAIVVMVVIKTGLNPVSYTHLTLPTKRIV